MSTLTSFLDQLVAEHYAIVRNVGETDGELRMRVHMAVNYDRARDGRVQRLLYLLARLRVSREARNYLPAGLDV